MAEIARLTRLALVNDAWNRAWTAFTEKRFPEALTRQRTTVALAEKSGSAMLPEIYYDLAVILQANGSSEEALTAVQKAIAANPRLREQALKDDDLRALRERIR